MRYQRLNVNLAADGSGDVTERRTPPTGLLYRIVYTQGNLAATADLTITDSNTGIVLYSQANITGSFDKYPRVLETLNTDGSALTTHDVPMVDGEITITIAQGGANTNGSVELFIV